MANKLTISETIRNLLKDNLGISAIFKQFFNGDPLAIPQSYLPCICIVKTKTGYPEGAPTGMDLRKHFVTIRLVFNKKDEFGKAADEAVLQKTMENIAEGIDETTSTYDDKSIMGILRKNYTLSNVTVQNIGEVTYRLAVNRPELITQEADIDLQLEEYIKVPTRQ